MGNIFGGSWTGAGAYQPTGFFGPNTGYMMNPQDYAAGFTNLNANSPYAGLMENYLKMAMGTTGGGALQGLSEYLGAAGGGQGAGSEWLTALQSPNSAGGWMNQFMGSVPWLQDLITGETGRLESDLSASQKRWTTEATANVGNELAGTGIHSSAFGRLVGGEVGGKAADAWTNIQGQRLGLLGNLLGQSMSGYQTGANALAGYGLQGAMGLAGMQQAPWLQGAQTYGQWGAPEWVAPDVATTPSGASQLWGAFKDYMGTNAQMASMILPFLGGGSGGGASGLSW